MNNRKTYITKSGRIAINKKINHSDTITDDYDHRWDDHPSWYTDNKSEQREMVRQSKIRRRENWD